MKGGAEVNLSRKTVPFACGMRTASVLLPAEVGTSVSGESPELRSVPAGSGSSHADSRLVVRVQSALTDPPTQGLPNSPPAWLFVPVVLAEYTNAFYDSLIQIDGGYRQKCQHSKSFLYETPS